MNMEAAMKQIGFIGVGIMGKSMARNLMKHGYTVHVYARTPKKAQDLIEEGAILHPSIAQCVKASEAVITMVGYPSDVEEVYCGENGIFASAKEGTLLIDMTTSSPKLAAMLHEHGKIRHLAVMDTTATSLAMDNDIPVIVFALAEPENIVRVLGGEKLGTLVK